MDYSKKMTNADAEYNLLGDIFKLYSKYYCVSKSEDYWNSLINDADELIIKHGKSKFAQNLALAVTTELSRRAKNECAN